MNRSMNWHAFKQALAAAASCLVTLWATSAMAADQATRDELDALRNDLKANRTALMAERMQLSSKESDAFWPIYRSYRGEMDKVTDGIVNLVLEYADDYPNVSDEKASEMVRKYLKLEANLLKVRAKYLKKFGKVLPGTKVFRFAQLDNRLDLGIRVGLAAEIPLMASGSGKPKAQ
jgi:hypothetical protein